MCSPVAPAIIMMVASAASQAAQIDAENKQAEAQGKAASLSAQADYQALQAEQDQLYDKSRLERLARTRQGLRERAKLRVSASDASLYGNTILREQFTSFADQGMDIGVIDANLRGSLAQNKRKEAKTGAVAEGRRNTAKASTSTGWGAGLQIGLAGLEGYAAGGGFSGPKTPSGMEIPTDNLAGEPTPPYNIGSFA